MSYSCEKGKDGEGTGHSPSMELLSNKTTPSPLGAHSLHFSFSQDDLLPQMPDVDYAQIPLQGH